MMEGPKDLIKIQYLLYFYLSFGCCRKRWPAQPSMHIKNEIFLAFNVEGGRVGKAHTR